VSVIQLFQPQEVVSRDSQYTGYLHEGLQRGLTAVGTPLADRRGIFTQLLCQPLVGVLLVGQDSLNSIQIFCHRESLFDEYYKCKNTNNPRISVHQTEIFTKKISFLWRILHFFSIFAV
jgi:hypothetical protein